jgi:hypothetical protein
MGGKQSIYIVNSPWSDNQYKVQLVTSKDDIKFIGLRVGKCV